MRCKRSVILILLLIGVVASSGPGNDQVSGGDRPDRPGKVVVSSPNPTLEEMVGISPVIFQGSVVGMRYSHHDGLKLPYTFVRFAGIEFLRKDSVPPVDKDGTLEISYLGGLLEDGRRLEVSVSPHFELGKRYVVFIRGGEWRLSPLPGVYKGVFRLIGRKQGDPVVATPGGVPIGEFVDGYPITATMVPSPDDVNEVECGARVENIPSGDEREKRMAPRKSLGAEVAEKQEAAERTKEQDTLGLLVEEDPDGAEYVAGLKGRWLRVMKFSELKRMIAELAKKTQGKYQEFEKVYAIPASDAGRQNLAAPSGQD